MSEQDMQADSTAAPIVSVVEQRIQRRIELFELWVKKKAVPLEHAKDLPNSLTKLRLWDVPSLGITRTSDPNGWTREHPDWGWRVVKAEKLMKRVLDLLDAPQQKRTATETTVKLRATLKERNHQLGQVNEQWQAAQEQLVVAKKEARYSRDVAKALETQLKASNATLAERDRQLAEVRQELMALQGLRSVPNK